MTQQTTDFNECEKLDCIQEMMVRGFDNDEGLFGLLSELWDRAESLSKTKPIDMIIFCPVCHTQHVDEPNPAICMTCGYDKPTHETDHFKATAGCIRFNPWTNPPHKSHRCHFCNSVFRIADVPTNGVKQINTKGENDSWAIYVQSTGD